MVAIVNGQGLGLNLDLAGILGERTGLGQTQAGRNGQRVYVNTGTGNLIVQSEDERLVDHGIDMGVLRTYNSQGQLDGEGGAAAMGLYARRIDLVLQYLEAEDDLIPDSTPTFGYLDDALLLELAWPVFARAAARASF